MSESPIDLSVVIVNWNSLALTDACLASIREQTHGIRYEVFVIDNGTTRDDGPTVLPAQYPWITFIRNDANLGFTKATGWPTGYANGGRIRVPTGRRSTEYRSNCGPTRGMTCPPRLPIGSRRSIE